MSHLPILPVLIPAFVGALIVLWMRHDLLLQRVASVAATASLGVVALILLDRAAGGEITVYRLGNWAAPFGIVLVLDRLAALMLVLTAGVALVTQLYALGSGWDRKGWHFHALWQFQLMGLNGAFLTGDAFNLFVFFEVLLIASYGLMTHGGGEMRLRAGVQYVVYNLVGSTLFLAALGTLYAVTGTLNMVDLAARVAALPPSDTALLRTGAVLLLLVFAVKAALVPLHFWMPTTYANAPGPVAALFAVMTKVGIYAVIRFFTLVFPPDGATDTLAADILLPAALATIIIGAIGVLGARHLGRLAAFAALGSVGTLTLAVAMFDARALSAALYYLPHSTMAAALLFVVADLTGARRDGDMWLRLRPPVQSGGMIAALFFAAAIAVAGLPPLSGFLGKLLILDAVRGHGQAPWLWTTVLATSLMLIVGLARAGSLVFWRAHELAAQPVEADPRPLPVRRGPIPAKLEPMEPIQDAGDATAPWLAFAAAMALIAGLVGMTLLAGPLTRFTEATAAQLMDAGPYLDAVLVRQEGAR